MIIPLIILLVGGWGAVVPVLLAILVFWLIILPIIMLISEPKSNKRSRR